jgi:hypothetical protein
MVISQNTESRIPVRCLNTLGNGVTGVLPADISDGTTAGNVTVVKGDGTLASIALVNGSNWFEIDAAKAPGLYHVVIPDTETDIAGCLQLVVLPAASLFLGSIFTTQVEAFISPSTECRLPVRCLSTLGLGVAGVLPGDISDGTTVGNATVAKADGTLASIALVDGVNWFEIDATKAPGLYHVVVPSTMTDLEGTLQLAVLPAASVFNKFIFTTQVAGAGPAMAFLSTGITPTFQQLVVTFNADAVISGPAALPSGYSITVDGPGLTPTVLAVSVLDDELTLITTAHTPGADYTLHMPTTGLVSDDARVYQGDFELEYVGPAAPAIVQLVKSIDARTLEIVFSRAVIQSEAEDVTNYSISPALTVFSAQRVTDFYYRLTTSQQVIDQLYEVTVVNVDGVV